MLAACPVRNDEPDDENESSGENSDSGGGTVMTSDRTGSPAPVSYGTVPLCASCMVPGTEF